MAIGLRGAALLMHGGGPTHVINASLAGATEECRRHADITALYGARHGVDGLLGEDFIDLSAQTPQRIAAVGRTPGSALGSSRAKVTDEDYERMLRILGAHEIRFLFFNGGNGSMFMAHRIASIAAAESYEMRVIGIPKTIDNDLAGTDHAPGFGSAALFFACAVRDIGEDIRALRGRVTIVEVMGRNAGWLTAATALARRDPDDPPHLIYLPERPLGQAQFLSDVETAFCKRGTVVIAACEGQKDENGKAIGELGTPDGFARRLSGNMAHSLAQWVASELKLHGRSEKPGLLGHSSMAFVSGTDWQEAYLCGQAAVTAAIDGHTDRMVTLVREPGSVYRASTGLCPLEDAAYVERLFPSEWIAPAGNDVATAFLDYAMPLAGPMRSHERLARAPVDAKLSRYNRDVGAIEPAP